jgi:hypothetical protein
VKKKQQLILGRAAIDNRKLTAYISQNRNKKKYFKAVLIIKVAD